MFAMVLASTNVIADSCVVLEGSTVINKCPACMEVTVRELRPREDRAAGLFTGRSRTVRLEAEERTTLQGNEHWAIGDLKACQ
jgi:hypothetical protein